VSDAATGAQLDAARALVADALAVGIDRIGPDTGMYGDPAWDSLGQLSVVLAVEDALQTEITEDAQFDALTSVRGIAALLASRQR
jgi:acyl carrier protein